MWLPSPLPPIAQFALAVLAVVVGAAHAFDGVTVAVFVAAAVDNIGGVLVVVLVVAVLDAVDVASVWFTAALKRHKQTENVKD